MDVTAPVPAARQARYRSLDHWRGLACLLVIVYHSTMVYLLTHGGAAPASMPDALSNLMIRGTGYLSAGVALFFVISGYCIAAAADNARRRSDSIRWYFVRRFRRIYPPFFVVLLCSIGFYFLVDYGRDQPLLSGGPWPQLRPWWYSASQWFGNLTLTETWRHHMFGANRGHFPGQAWTLCYEEQFYFVTGMLLAFCPGRFFVGTAVVSGLTAAAVVGSRAFGVPIDGFFFDGSWLLFAAGVLVYYMVNHATSRAARGAFQAVLICAIPIGWMFMPIHGATAGFALAAALPLLQGFDDRIVSARLLRPLRISGEMCYSLYLVHLLPVKAISYALQLSGYDGACRCRWRRRWSSAGPSTSSSSAGSSTGRRCGM
jgi:peptidoglycan/LPS O-acetylase OafA/YrhL